jgi:hypothetical protein
MPYAILERSREIAIVVTAADETAIRKLHDAMLRVSFAGALDGVTLRRHL